MERKILGPRSPSPNAATPSVGGRSAEANAGSSKGRSRSPSASGDEDKKSSSSRSRGSSTSSADGKKDRKKTDIDGRTNKNREGGEGKKAKAAEPKISAEGTVFASLPKLKDTPAEEQGELFCQKARFCAIVYDFRNAEAELPEKEGKRQTLVELLDHANVSKTPVWAEESVMSEAVDMVGANIFRTLTRRERTPLDMLEAEDDEPAMDPAWPHLELVYELLLRIISSKEVDTAMATKQINQKFVVKLLELFHSDDPRERESLKTIMNRIYAKYSSLRSAVRRAIQNTLLQATTEDEVQNGMAERLEILSRYINGFQTPLKEENREILTKVLMPLHKVEWLTLFHSQLLDCTKKFTEKDPRLAHNVVVSLLRFWPYNMASKQILFLGEIEDMVNVMPLAEFKRVQDALARRLAACVSFDNSDVAERTLALWRSDKFVKLITKECRDQFPIIISALYNNATQHWHNNVHSRTFEVLKMLMERDPELFDSSSTKHRKKVEEEERREAERARKWAILEALHQRKLTEPPPQEELDPSPRASAAPSGALQTVPSMPSIADAQQRQRKEERRATRQHSPRPQTFKGLRMEKERYGVSVSWDRGDVDVEVGLQALVVDVRGRIIAAVHEHNPVALQSLVHRSGDRPVVDGARGECSGIIWVSLSNLPEQAAVLVFVVCSLSGGKLAEVADCGLHVVEEQRDREAAHFILEEPVGHAGVVAVMRRGSCGGGGGGGGPDRTWSLTRSDEFAKNGRHFMDILEPTVGKAVREALPSLPKKQKVSATLSALDHGDVACLPQPSQVKWLFVGLSWDLEPTAGHDGGDGLAVSALFFGEQGEALGAVGPGGAEVFGARHGGKGLLGQGLFLDLAGVPQAAVQVFLVGHLPNSRFAKAFDHLQRPHCCVVDPLGTELLRHVPVVQQQEAAGKGPERGLLAGRFVRLERAGPPTASASGRNSGRGGGGSRWAFQALGFTCAGRTWEDSLPELQAVFQKPLGAFQQLPSDMDMLAAGRCVVSL